MEQWRGYVEQERILEDHTYITGILGINLPLDESGQIHLSEDLKEHIIQELENQEVKSFF